MNSVATDSQSGLPGITLTDYSGLENENNEVPDGDYKIIFCVTDKAGTAVYKQTSFTYDTTRIKIPDEISDENNIFKVNSASNPFTGYDFSIKEDENVLELTVYRTDGLWTEIPEDIDLILPNYFPADENETEPVTKTKLEGSITFEIKLAEGFASNARYDVLLEIYDMAGNPVEHSMQVYLPVILAGHQTDYLSKPEEDYFYDTDGVHYNLIWDIKPVTGFTGLNLYKEEGTPVSKTLDGFFLDDVGISAHGTYGYKLTGINGAGFESTVWGSFKFDRIVDNIDPAVDVLNITYNRRHNSEGTFYLGPKSGITVPVIDDDGDSVRARIVLADNTSIALSDFQILDGGIYTFDYSSLSGEFRTDGMTIEPALEYQDYWGTEEDDRGESLFYTLDSFVYDSRGPEVVLTPDYREGCRVSHDGFNLNVEDELSGDESTTVEVSPCHIRISGRSSFKKP